MHEGTVFAQAVSGDGNGDNTVYVQDAIIASNATVPCTVTLGKDAVLRNFGGMSAVRATDQAKIVMESGSVIEDTLTGYTRTKGSGADSVGPAGAIWLQGGTLVMEEGSKIRNMDGRGVYADGGKVEIGGAISSIAANKSAMWQANSGIVIHLRNNAEGTLTSTALIEKISSGSIIYCAGDAKSFKMENGSKITDCPKLNGNVIYAKNCTVVIDGEISNVYATGNHILQTDGGTAVTIGENGRILNNHAYYGAVYINGTDEHLDIYGKINGNICANRGGGVVLSNNGGNHNATMYEGAEICNNKAEQTGGGAMISKGVFTMNGGTISGNISGTNSAKGEADRIGGGVFVRRGGQFIMNGGAIENNATTAFGGGVCFDASDYGGTVPKIELNAGTIRNNLMQVTVGDEYQHLARQNRTRSSDFDGSSCIVRLFYHSPKPVLCQSLDNGIFISSCNGITDRVCFIRQYPNILGFGECDRQRMMFGHGNNRIILQFEMDIIFILGNFLENRNGISSVSPIFTCGFAQLCPVCSIVIGNVPISLSDFEFGSNAVFTVRSVRSIFSI